MHKNTYNSTVGEGSAKLLHRSEIAYELALEGMLGIRKHSPTDKLRIFQFGCNHKNITVN